MWQHIYVDEKLRELREQLELARHRFQVPTPSRRISVFAPLARATGRGLRRLGEGLESWSTPSPPDECEALLDSPPG